MDRYVTGAIIKKRREAKGLTQSRLAEMLAVSDKAVSKWETAGGYPDITMLEPLAKALGISTIELLSGENVTNRNCSANMLRSEFYVCPVCGNVVYTVGKAVVSCCGIILSPLKAKTPDGRHIFTMEKVEDEWYVTTDHPMTKDHYISFVVALSDNSVQLVKLYPEGMADARFKYSRVRRLYLYCNQHGLFKIKP